jgi:hypothetical protein
VGGVSTSGGTGRRGEHLTVHFESTLIARTSVLIDLSSSLRSENDRISVGHTKVKSRG